MKNILTLILFAILFIYSCRIGHQSSTGKNVNLKTETLTLNYNALSCNCAQWSETKYNDNPDKREYFYIEPANNKLINADTLWQGNNLPLQIEITGQLVTQSGFPTGFISSKEKPEVGKVFRYSKIRVIKNGN